MADNIVYRFSEMNSAAEAVDGIAGNYSSSGDAMISSIMSAIGSWEGESKDKLVTLLTGDVSKFVTETVKTVVESVAMQIRSSAENMQKTDADLAANIPSSLGG